MTRRRRAAAWLAALACLWLCAGCGEVGERSAAPAPDTPSAEGAAAEGGDSAEGAAEEGVAEEGADEEGADDAPSVGSLERRILGNPSTLIAVFAVKFLPAGIGLLLLVLWWLRRDKIRAGVLPPPARVEATATLQPGPAYTVAALAMLVVPGVAIVSIAEARGVEPAALPLWITTSVVACCTLAAAVPVLLRRRWMQRAAPAERARLFPFETPEPTPPPGPVRALGLAGWGYCVAVCVVLPVTIVWVLVIEGAGLGAQAQKLVTRVVSPDAAYEPWLIAVFGVVIAPLTEETLFRGMLYPATKRAFGGGRRAVWIGAVIVSAVFALVHQNLAAMLPLFALALVLTWVMERTNSLMACVLIHALHNLFSLLPLLLLGAGP